jgi:hypothetical protein
MKNVSPSSKRSRPPARIESGPCRERHREKVPQMKGRRGGHGLPRQPRWAHPVGQDKLSNWTTSPVHTDRTDTPNLGIGKSDRDWKTGQPPTSRCRHHGADVTVPTSRCRRHGADVTVPTSRCRCHGADVTVRQAGAPRTDSIFVDRYAKMAHATGSKLGQEYAFRAVLICWRLVLAALPGCVESRSFPGDFRRGIATL